MTGTHGLKCVLATCVGSIAWFGLPRPALADDPRLGVDLFQSGRQLMNAGDFEKACPLLRDSQKADPQPGTQLNLALCYEKLGKTASAWSTYADLTQSGGPLQQQVAKAALERLGPKLSRLKIDLCVDPNFDNSKLVVSRNGEEVGASVLGRPSPVDAGEYLIEARAAGYAKWSRTVKVAKEGDLESVEICDLVRDPALPGGVVQPSTSATSPAAAAVTTTATAIEPLPPRRNFTAAYVVGGTGIVAAVVGTVFGIVAANQKSHATDECTGKSCSAEGWSRLGSAKSSADIATVSFVLAGVAAGATVYLVLKPSTKEEPSKSAQAARVGLHAAPTGLTVSYAGVF
jgi:hypothetical protein